MIFPPKRVAYYSRPTSCANVFPCEFILLGRLISPFIFLFLIMFFKFSLPVQGHFRIIPGSEVPFPVSYRPQMGQFLISAGNQSIMLLQLPSNLLTLAQPSCFTMKLHQGRSVPLFSRRIHDVHDKDLFCRDRAS